MDKELLAHRMEDCNTDLSNIQIQVAAIAVISDKIDKENLGELAPKISLEARGTYEKITEIKRELEEIKWEMLELKK